jgi:hypothetical protein
MGTEWKDWPANDEELTLNDILDRRGLGSPDSTEDELSGYWAFNNISPSAYDEYSFLDLWNFAVEEETSSIFDYLDDGEIGILAELTSTEDRDANSVVAIVYNSVHLDSNDVPTFSSGEWNSTGVIYTFESTLASAELAALEELYETSTTLSNAMATMAAEALAAAGLPANPLNKIKSPVIDEDAFDVFEKEEAAQTVTVSTTYETTT